MAWPGTNLESVFLLWKLLGVCFEVSVPPSNPPHPPTPKSNLMHFGAFCRKRLSRDRCAEPLVGERVPYVIVCGSPGLPLIQLVREPHALLEDRALRINAVYYITKQVLPPLDRLFCLLGVDVKAWYSELPRIVRTSAQPEDEGKKVSRILRCNRIGVVFSEGRISIILISTFIFLDETSQQQKHLESQC